MDYKIFTAFLNESANDIGDLALYVTPELTILYKATPELKEGLIDYDILKFTDNIVGVFEIKEDIYMGGIYAKKGYGPLLYKIGMQISPEGKMAPYWNSNHVTRQAANIWKEFFNGKGAKDVNKEFFGVDEKNYRNYYYSLKKKLKLKKNVEIHEKFLRDDRFGEQLGLIKDLGEDILVNKMRSIY